MEQATYSRSLVTLTCVKQQEPAQISRKAEPLVEIVAQASLDRTEFGEMGCFRGFIYLAVVRALKLASFSCRILCLVLGNFGCGVLHGCLKLLFTASKTGRFCLTIVLEEPKHGLGVFQDDRIREGSGIGKGSRSDNLTT